MTYEYMGMGTAEEATRLVTEAREADARDDFLRAAALLEQAIAADPSRANEFRARQVQMYAEGGDCVRAQQLWAQLSPSLPASDPNTAQYRQFVEQCRPGGLRPSPFDELSTPNIPGGAAPATEKQSWWSGDVEGMGLFVLQQAGHR